MLSLYTKDLRTIVDAVAGYAIWIQESTEVNLMFLFIGYNIYLRINLKNLA